MFKTHTKKHKPRGRSGDRTAGGALLKALGLASLVWMVDPAAPGSLATGAAARDHASAREIRPGQLFAVPHLIEYEDGSSLLVERGVFYAPLDYDRPEKGVLQLPFTRVKAVGKVKAPPVFRIAGGPGSSIAYYDGGLLSGEKRNDFVEFARQFADVVMLEHRGVNRYLDHTGVGPGLPSLTCRQSLSVGDLSGEITLKSANRLMAENARRCRAKLEKAGLDLSAYTITAMADDINALREALGYDKISLFGNSYGSQLGLTVVRRHEGVVHRAVFGGVEGPDDTYDLPATADAQLRKIAAEVAADPTFGKLLPDLVGALEALFRRVETEDVRVSLDAPDGEKTEIVLNPYIVRNIFWSTATFQGYREGIVDGVRLLAAAAGGDLAPLARAQMAASNAFDGQMNAMIPLVDCASGMSAERRAEIERTAPNSILGEGVVDGGLHGGCAGWAPKDLGEAFRKPTPVETEMLLVNGSLDGYTPPDNAYGVARWAPNAHVTLVNRGDHSSVYAMYGELGYAAALEKFLIGDKPAASFPEAVEMPPLEFNPSQ